GGSQHAVVISDTAATPGYLAGPLPAGEWVVQIDTHRIMPGAPVHYKLDIAISTETEAPMTHVLPEGRRNGGRDRGTGWYRGDLHSHTDHSDAGERTVADLIAAAQDAGLDFLFVTDHNTTSTLAALETIDSGNLLMAGGMELTTFWGHAL
ncbi:MAG: PHP domain-containing protein, partial [Caldilineaceae bacterium]|nr:PHP domain-containing protein [Caldilineaceae bacterium]